MAQCHECGREFPSHVLTISRPGHMYCSDCLQFLAALATSAIRLSNEANLREEEDAVPDFIKVMVDITTVDLNYDPRLPTGSKVVTCAKCGILTVVLSANNCVGCGAVIDCHGNVVVPS